MERENFFKKIDQAVDFFKLFDKNEIIRIISHLDSDGICAGAILIKSLSRENIKFSITIVPHLDEALIKQLANETNKNYIFSDLGSGQINLINKYLSHKKIIILDHHKPTKTDKKMIIENMVHVNPMLDGINDSRELSGAGVVYYFSYALNPINQDLAYIAIVGAVGDNQEKGGFVGMNHDLLDTAIRSNTIEIKKGLRLFGAQTKPLHKILEYSIDPYIPGVTGSEVNALKFLRNLNINPKHETEWKKMCHLTEKELGKLAKGIIEQRVDEKNPDDVYGNLYLIKSKVNSPIRDAREFSTVLNACGRLGKASFGISALLGGKKDDDELFEILMDYRREIINALTWYKNNLNSDQVIKEEGFLIINSKHNFLPTIAGTIASILSRSNELDPGTIIISMARTDNRKTKISIRIVENKAQPWIDLLSILKLIINLVGGEVGGHKNAAGALIDSNQEGKFVKQAIIVLEKHMKTEVI